MVFALLFGVLFAFQYRLLDSIRDGGSSGGVVLDVAALQQVRELSSSFGGAVTTPASPAIATTTTTTEPLSKSETKATPVSSVKDFHSDATANKHAVLDIVDCPSLLAAKQSNTLHFQDPNHNHPNQTALQQFTGPQIPGFWISVHTPQYDPPRAKILTDGHYYEVELERIWRTILTQSPRGAIVLDVGANIGYFSLVSLALEGNFVVEAFEPNPVNALRLCESVQLNQWDNQNRLHLHQVGISDQPQFLPFWVSPNPGQSQFYADKNHPDLINKQYTLRPVISLDELAYARGWLLPTTTTTTTTTSTTTTTTSSGGGATHKKDVIVAILKIDVEGQEYKALAGAKQLLQSHMVQNIFMEVSVRTNEEVETSHMSLQLLLNAGYQLVGQGGFSGPHRHVPWPHDDQLVANIVRAAQETYAKQLNVWFQPAQLAATKMAQAVLTSE